MTPAAGRTGRTMAALRLPVAVGMAGMDNALARSGGVALVWLMLGVVASWWVYVPIHELFHVWGCLLAGGDVSRLEIDGQYGAAWLARFFPYVTPGSEYAGRLSGFDTGGSDAVYLCTVYFPYLLTLFIGVPGLVIATRRRCAVCFGAAIPWAYTPFLSLTGDFYELGSIPVSRLASPWLPDAAARWRSDDLFLLLGGLYGTAGDGGWADAAGILAASLLGAFAAFLTFALGYRFYSIGKTRHATDPATDSATY